MTAVPGSAIPGSAAPGGGAAIAPPDPPGPLVDLGVRLPDLQVIVAFGANKRILNGAGAQSVCDRVRWSSVIPGGHHTFSCRIADSERSTHTSTYRYGATVTLRQAPSGATAETGQIFWQGYLRTPIPSDDGTCELVGNGWHQLLAERDDALMWQSRYYGDWQPADAEGFSLGITNDSIDAQVNNSSLQWSVKKGQDLNNGDKAKLIWYYGDTQVLPKRLAMTVYKNQPMTGGGSPNYSLQLTRYDGPGANASRFIVQDFVAALGNSNVGNNGTTVIINNISQTVPHPVIGLEFLRNGATSGGSGNSFKITCRDVRLNDLAPNDTYLSSLVVGDIATKMGFTAGSKVSTTTDNILPLFWQDSPWWDLIQYLSVGQNFKWAVWENNPNPEFEFRAWTSGPVWTTNGYGSSATSIANLAPDDEVYNVVDVAFHKGSSARVRHIRVSVSPDPFSGLTPARQRTYAVTLQDPQPDETLATSIATRLAGELGTEQYAGTVTGSFFTSGGDKSSYEVRAGDRLTISDFPGGSRTVRVYQVDHRDDGPSVLTIGKVPSSLDRTLWYIALKRKRRGFED